MSTPNVSVIIPLYNSSQTIEACLKSLAQQTLQSFEVIMVDDGSSDTTASIVTQSSLLKDRRTLLTQAHLGPGKARNLGAQNAQGKILVFVDADMTFAPDFLQQLIQPIEVGQALGTFTQEEFVSNWDNPWARCWNYEYVGQRTKRRVPENGNTTSPVFRAINKEAFDRVGGFDAIGYNDDWTLSQKLQTQALAAPGAVMYHANPDSAEAVIKQATWVGKRDYKAGELGRLWALVRANPVFSLVLGSLKAIRFREPHYLIFKHVYNAGITAGILMRWINKSHAK